MSLKVWLPLNGNTNNQGLSTISMSGSVYSWSSGKIGTGAYFSGSSSSATKYLYNNSTEFNYTTQDFSWMCWVKLTPTIYTTSYIFTVGRADAGGYGYGFAHNGSSGIVMFGNQSWSFSIPYGSWQHVAFVKSGTSIKVYLNGSIVINTTFTGSYPTYSDGKGLGVGCFYYSGGGIYPLIGYLNDFRIYDSAVPYKEIKEASKALILNYKLDNYSATSFKVYDSSGYMNTGSIIGTLSYMAGSPRYSSGTGITSSSYKIYTPSLNLTDISDSYTISWWAKGSSFGANGEMMWGFSDGNRLNIMHRLCLNTGDSAENPFYVSNTTTVIAEPALNTWHHFALTGDGTSSKLYVDGSLYGISKTYKSITGTQIYLNGWDSSSDYAFNGYYSDFRIYGTTLSADDIKELYNTSALLCPDYTLYGCEYLEGDEVSISKTGIVSSADFIESSEASINSSTEIKMNSFIEW